MIFRNAFLMAAITTCGAAHAQAPDPSGSVLSAPTGRFVFGQISSARRDQYMLDTQTGRLWQLVCAGSEQAPGGTCGKIQLQMVFYSPDFSGDKFLTATPSALIVGAPSKPGAAK